MSNTLVQPVPVVPTASLSMRRVVQTWWPLAMSWLLMGVELPFVSAMMARLPSPNISLAAYGGIIFPLALLIESPIIMLLSASTALCKDWDSYRKVRRFMIAAGAALTALHLVVVLTPLWNVVVEGLIGAPREIVGPARIGMTIMTPWTWTIAYRRFQQGVLIRHGRSNAVGIGTAVRLASNATVLAIGFVVGGIPGVVVGSLAVAVGVTAEAIFVGVWVQPVLRGPLRAAPPVREPLTVRSFLAFYVPLSMTSLLGLLILPIGSAGLSRMPLAIESLAIWPVISGFVFMLRSPGFAFNEVVVALIDEPHAYPPLRRFAWRLATVTSALLLIVAATPLAGIWFARVSALSAELAALARSAIWIPVAMPGLTVLLNFFQGIVVHSRRTKPIPQAMGVSLITIATILTLGVLWGRTAGLYIGLTASAAGQLAQTLWLRHKSGPERARLAALLSEAPSLASPAAAAVPRS